MKISRLELWVVNVPYRRSFVSSFEVRRGTTRTVLRLTTDDGATGWGETMHGAPTAALIRKLFDTYRGTDPFDVEGTAARLRMVPFFYGYIGYAALAGLEMACYDLIGRVVGQPVRNLVGGQVRTSVPITYVATPDEDPAADTARGLADDVGSAIATLGVGAVKLKGSSDPRRDVALLSGLREAFPELALRVDPNGHWDVSETLRLAGAIEELDLEYLEDPCWDLEQMAQVRARVRVPLCTNMCVVRFEDVAPALRMGAVDVVHGDVFKWGGINPTRRLAGICETVGWGMNLHSGGELGLSTAAHLQVAAALPQLRYAIDSVYYLFEDDILPERLTIAGGAMELPPGPGLGVEPSVERLEHYQQRNAREGDLLL
ncbi:MAG TPA: enolase C-terminal domain-like protein [Pseudonocardia sp.]|nr:enolase C-terminal domain-like protein [Pseudonocardia sp.]